MTIPLPDQQVRLLRMRAQRLTSGQTGAVGLAEIVRGMCGIQAQDPHAAALAVRARGAGLCAEDVENACRTARSVVRAWVMRGTLHLVAAEDLGWLVALLGPIFMAAGARRRRELGLDEDTCARGVRAIRTILSSEGPLTRTELVAQLARQGIVLDRRSQAPIHLIRHAALAGLVCHGPDRAPDEPTYVLVEDWLGTHAALPEEEALAELARRYLQAYAPADLEDFAAWSGLPRSQARLAWTRVAHQSREVAMGDRPGWMLVSQATQIEDRVSSPGMVKLLPSFDPYLLGYRNRDLLVSPAFAPNVNRGGGILHPIVVHDGRVVGTWRQTRKRVTEVVVEPFEELAAKIHAPLEAEVADLARFLRRDAHLTIAQAANRREMSLD